MAYDFQKKIEIIENPYGPSERKNIGKFKEGHTNVFLSSKGEVFIERANEIIVLKHKNGNSLIFNTVDEASDSGEISNALKRLLNLSGESDIVREEKVMMGDDIENLKKEFDEKIVENVASSKSGMALRRFLPSPNKLSWNKETERVAIVGPKAENGEIQPLKKADGLYLTCSSAREACDEVDAVLDRMKENGEL